MRVRTPAIRCDRPPVQGLPAFSPAQCPRARCQLVLPLRTIPCDAKDHARPRKYLGQNLFSKRGVQVEFEYFITWSPLVVLDRTICTKYEMRTSYKSRLV